MNTETLKHIASRFSCRDFSDEIPEDGLMDAIAQAAIASPSGMNCQPWQFIVVSNKDLITEMDIEGMKIISQMEDKTLYERIMGRGGKLLYNAPRMVLIALKTENSSGMEHIDCGIAAQNIVLAATSLGLGSLHCGLIKFSFAGEREKEFRARLQIPQGFDVPIAVLLGYPNKTVSPHTPDESKITVIK